VKPGLVYQTWDGNRPARMVLYPITTKVTAGPQNLKAGPFLECWSQSLQTTCSRPDKLLIVRAFWVWFSER